jgi:phosphohistidine phosphatase
MNVTKTLFLLRHAKSSWDNIGMTDFDRPLNDRGFATAPSMGKAMHNSGFHPQLVVSSPAKRARQTAELVKEAAQFSCEIKFEGRIYAASTSELVSVISELDDAAESAMLIGHNPGIENMVHFLTGDFKAMPTAALAVVEIEVEAWSNISAGCGELRELLTPKTLK